MVFHCEVVFNGPPLVTIVVGRGFIAFKSVQHMLLIHTIYGWVFQGLNWFCHTQHKLDVPGLLSALSSISILTTENFHALKIF